ncbi:hypothetical protein CEP54_015103 [Fusarium duplospermum]|uniref:Methyltransferase n=1 Tax=Fusarium duplospermum TaxID=1325734 RepID=A0A428NRK6_9HYPO|nr:hypothetical protein CEP54_015103 [Fusarium duplospermum]
MKPDCDADHDEPRRRSSTAPMAHEQPPHLFPGDRSEPDDDDDDIIDSTFGDDDKSTTTLDPEELHMLYVYGREYTSAYVGACSCTPTDDKYRGVMDSKYRSATEEPGWSLHLAPLKENIQLVLDIGTGIGSWAIQFAETHPSSTVIGTDIAPIQPLRVPPNVQFELDDCNRNWTWSPRSFDYVRICNMTGNVKDWPRLFRMAGQCTRIGGYIESSEDSIWFGSTIPGTSLPRALQVWNLSIMLAGIRSGRSFHVVEYDQQMQSMVEAGIEI